MREGNYINIQSFMVEKLKLTGNELVIYALIYGFSQDGKSQFRGSLSYIEDWLKISRNTVLLNINKLIQKGLIIKVLDKGGSLYTALSSSVLGSTETEQEECRNGTRGSAETEHNIYNNINNNINNISKVDKKSSIELIYKKYKDGVDIESKYLYPSATKIYLEVLLSIYTEKQLLSSIDNYFAETERKWRKSPKYFFSNSKKSDNYRIFEGFLKEETTPKKDLDINNLFF